LSSIVAPWIGYKARKRDEKAKNAGVEGGSDPMIWTEGMAEPGKKEPGLHPGQRYLLKDFNGILAPGEMMLVVGRPGSGCSTFLKALAGLTSAFAGVYGSVEYGSLKSDSKDLRPYQSMVCFNSEEDVHDPNLTVDRTMNFATRTETVAEAARTKNDNDEVPTAPEHRTKMKSDLLQAFGISHTHSTKVGDQYVRGVSGELACLELMLTFQAAREEGLPSPKHSRPMLLYTAGTTRLEVWTPTRHYPLSETVEP
jgi:ATP-binding cassette subfamily G (WHITE) protein 2 (SNQ2)